VAIERVVRDFQITKRDTPDEKWQFNFSVKGCSFAQRDNEWLATLDEFKREIPLEQRSPIYKDGRFSHWEVKASDRNAARLTQLFDNFEMCLFAARAQMVMFEEVE